jgi:uncharacterized membrane protein AbrB (regulator of aidB expression)
MSPISITLFTIVFIAVSILVGNFYTKIHISYNAWLIITIICAIVFIGEMIAEKLFFKKGLKD